MLAFLASNFYSNAIFVVTFGFAVYLWWWRPDLYRPLRNILVLANLIGFAVFWAFPVAPPRMLPGFIDVVVKAGGLGAWHNTLIKHADQFAAMPSMHLGYAVWCALVAWRVARHRVSKRVAIVFGIAYPLLTTVIVIGTGNHYLLDVLAGTTTVVLSVVLLEVLPGSLRRRLPETATGGETGTGGETATGGARQGSRCRRPRPRAPGLVRPPRCPRRSPRRCAGGRRTAAQRPTARIRFRATDVDWASGDGPEVSGPMVSLVLAMTGRKGAHADLAGEGLATLAQRP